MLIPMLVRAKARRILDSTHQVFVPINVATIHIIPPTQVIKILSKSFDASFAISQYLVLVSKNSFLSRFLTFLV
ncbi:MAG: hypothetical protein LBG59_02175 [Candidatus Peribacteria bacterium]|jgi:uroporphyrinogen-III synthase|nr:hypothetical protein [Candidatus Peribacteria bacterium]